MSQNDVIKAAGNDEKQQ